MRSKSGRWILRRRCAGRGYGDVVECDEEEDGSRNVDIGICCVDESHYVWILQKGTLEAGFMEDVQGLLEGYELKCMVSCKVDYALVDSKGSNRPRYLVYLMLKFVSSESLLSRNSRFMEVCDDLGIVHTQ